MRWQLLPINQFRSHITAWDQLNAKGPDTPLLSSDFVEPLLKHFSTAHELLAICGDINSPSAMAILTKPKFGAWMTFQPSQAPIGLWLNRSGEPLDILVNSLRKSLSFPTFIFSITQQDPELLDRPADNKNLTSIDYINTGRVTVDGSFDDYWSNRGKNLRQNLKRQRNRLNREETKTTLKIITDPASIENAILTYGELESAGWKNNRGTAIHADNAQGKFYLSMLKNFCKKQQGVVFQYLYNQNVVATDLCIKNAKSLIILKTTYDEEIKTTSPAMLMRQDAFEYIFNEQSTALIEFYGKVMNWHTKWTKEIRTMYHINCKIF